MKLFAQKFLLIIALPLLIMQGCKKPEIEHPEVKTLTIAALSPARIIVTGEITHKGIHKISDHGFIYGYSSSVQEGNGTKVSLGSEVSEGIITKEVPITTSYNYERTIYVRTYLTNDKGTAYGAVINIKLSAIATSSLNPTSGKTGDKVTIYGSYSSLAKEDVKVNFGNVPANIVSVSPSQIIVEVPAGINSSSSYNQVSVTLTVAGQTSTVSSYFTIKPTFTDFTPKTGAVGSTVYISAANLPSSYYYSNLKIYFGNIYTTSYSINSGNVSVNVPGSITTEKVTIAVEIDGVKTTLPGEYTLIAPAISSISPTTAWAGSSVIISGGSFPSGGYYNNFGSYVSNMSVTIADIPANISINYTNQLYVTIPANLPAGDHKVVVKCGPFSVEATQKLKIKENVFSGFSPSSGAPGKEITLTGEFNPNLSYSVYFGSNVSTGAFNVTSSSMKVYVPGNLDAGDVKISIRSGSLNLLSQDNFTVLAPSITSISPTSGVAGTIVTITGTGFSPNTGYYGNTVKFGTTATPTILSASESTLRVLVPSNLNPGAMKISVTNSYGQTVVSPTNFTVTN